MNQKLIHYYTTLTSPAKTKKNRPILTCFVVFPQQSRIKSENPSKKKPLENAKNGANRLDSKGKRLILSQFFKFEKNCVQKSVKLGKFR